MTLNLKKDDFQAFFEAPFNAYGEDSPYVSPLKADLKRFLDRGRNPLFQGASDLCFFTAHRDGRAIGRITAHVHAESNALHGVNWGYFGYFDCADDAEAGELLLTAAEDWCRDLGFDRIIGNFNLTAMQQIGVLTKGFEHPPFLDQIYSPPHIASMLESNGYAAEFPMTTFAADLTRLPDLPLGPKQQAILDNPDFAFAPITRRTIPARMEEARAILNASFADNPMFVAVTKEEFDFQAKDMKWIMDPRISAVLHHKGAPAGCIICVPDLNPFLHRIRSRIGLSAPYHFLRHKWTNTRAILIYAGVMPELQGQGLNPLMMHRVIQNAKAAGYTMIGNTWIADVNAASLAQREKAGAQMQHRLHLFAKSL